MPYGTCEPRRGGINREPCDRSARTEIQRIRDTNGSVVYPGRDCDRGGTMNRFDKRTFRKLSRLAGQSISIFWVTDSYRRACAIDRLQARGLVTLEPTQFPYLRVHVKGAP